MTAYAWPAAWVPSWCTEPMLVPNVREFASPYSGAWSGVDLLGEFFRMVVQLPPVWRRDSGAVAAFFNRLRGVHTVTAWHFARPQPMGTMRASPTLATAVVQGAEQLSITTTAGATVKAGDMLGAGGQLFQTAEDAAANGSGLIVVPTVNRARAAIASGQPVAWDKPTANWRVPNHGGAPITHVPVISEIGEIELVQTW